MKTVVLNDFLLKFNLTKDGRKALEKFQLTICHLNLGWVLRIQLEKKFVPIYNFIFQSRIK